MNQPYSLKRQQKITERELKSKWLMGLKRTLTNKAPNEFIIFSARFMVSFCQKVQVLKKLITILYKGPGLGKVFLVDRRDEKVVASLILIILWR